MDNGWHDMVVTDAYTWKVSKSRHAEVIIIFSVVKSATCDKKISLQGWE